MKLLMALSIIFLVLSVWVLGSKENKADDDSGVYLSEARDSKLSEMEKLDFKGQKYRYAVIDSVKLETIELIPNHQERLYSPELVKLYNCSGLINGGFYGKDLAPIGWLVSGGQEVSKPVGSSLLNGFVAIGKEGQVSINNLRPGFEVREGVQSGPLLIDKARPVKLTIKNDEPRRRVVATVSGQDELSFWVLTGEESFFSGPLLAEMPEVMLELSQQTGINMVQAINLDGGSASVFVSETVVVREISSVGNFFCLH